MSIVTDPLLNQPCCDGIHSTVIKICTPVPHLKTRNQPLPKNPQKKDCLKLWHFVILVYIKEPSVMELSPVSSSTMFSWWMQTFKDTHAFQTSPFLSAHSTGLRQRLVKNRTPPYMFTSDHNNIPQRIPYWHQLNELLVYNNKSFWN